MMNGTQLRKTKEVCSEKVGIEYHVRPARKTHFGTDCCDENRFGIEEFVLVYSKTALCKKSRAKKKKLVKF